MDEGIGSIRGNDSVGEETLHKDEDPSSNPQYASNMWWSVIRHLAFQCTRVCTHVYSTHHTNKIKISCDVEGAHINYNAQKSPEFGL